MEDFAGHVREWCVDQYTLIFIKRSQTQIQLIFDIRTSRLIGLSEKVLGITDVYLFVLPSVT